MGYASHEGKAFAIGVLQKLDPSPEVFLDLGAGAGSWMEAVRPWFLDSRWLAMEVWADYVTRFCLPERYDLTLPLDIRTAAFPQSDVVIMGDVLEHMTKPEALDVWARAREAARLAVILSVPIIHYPQGHVHGNPFQEHLHHWNTSEILRDLDGITDHIEGETVGTFVAVT